VGAERLFGVIVTQRQKLKSILILYLQKESLCPSYITLAYYAMEIFCLDIEDAIIQMHMLVVEKVSTLVERGRMGLVKVRNSQNG